MSNGYIIRNIDKKYKSGPIFIVNSIIGIIPGIYDYEPCL